MRATHEVQVWNHKGSWRTRCYACEVIGRHPAPGSFADAGRMERTVVLKLDVAWKALGFKSRMAFLRDAMLAYLRNQVGAEARAAADAIEAEGF